MISFVAEGASVQMLRQLAAAGDIDARRALAERNRYRRKMRRLLNDARAQRRRRAKRRK